MKGKLKVVVIRGASIEEIDLYATTVPEVMSLLRLQKGQQYVQEIIESQCKYIVGLGEDLDSLVSLTPEVVLSDLDSYDTLYIVQDIEGQEPISMSAFLIFMAKTVAMMAISMAINLVMQALSPTQEFSADPAAKQNSSKLFNGAPIIRDQGCSVPLVFGTPYAGAVLISSGLFSEEI